MDASVVQPPPPPVTPPVPPPPVVPTPSPATPSKPKNILVTAVIVIIVLLSLGTAGFFAYNNYQRAHQNTPAPTPTPIPSPAVVPGEAGTQEGTADWKTYTNPEGNFSFKYPGNFQFIRFDWGVTGFFDNPSIFQNCQKYVQQSVKDINNACLNTKFNFNGFQTFTQIEYQNFLKSRVEPKDYVDSQGRTWKTDQVLGEAYNFQGVITHNGNFFSVSFQANQSMFTSEESQSFFDQILSTFKFTDKDTTKTCKTDKDCSDNYFCDYSMPGGMGPNGYVTGQPYGSQQCILKCQNNDQCPSGQCQNFEIVGGDIATNQKGCKP